MIAYRLGGDVYKVLTVQLEVDTILLISHFVGTNEATTIKDDEGKGYICQDKICSEIGGDRSGTVLKYNKTGTSCDFQIVE